MELKSEALEMYAMTTRPLHSVIYVELRPHVTSALCTIGMHYFRAIFPAR